MSADLELTGKPAQFGEEVIADTLSKLLDQFVSCVAGRFAEGIGDPAEEEDAVDEESATEQTIEIDAVPGAAESAPVPEPAPAAAGPSSAAGRPSVAQPAAAPQPSGPYRYTPPQNTSQPDVKVAASIASMMIKRYGPALGVLSLVAVIAVKIISRLRRR